MSAREVLLTAMAQIDQPGWGPEDWEELADFHAAEVRAESAEEIERLRAQVESLIERSRFLGALEAAGVDNWDGYHLAFGDDEEDEE